MVSIEAAHPIGMINAGSFNEFIVDITVLSKAVAYPTDSHLLEKFRQRLLNVANEHQLTCARITITTTPGLRLRPRYAHTKQCRRMKNSLRALRSLVGRGWREIKCKIDQIPAVQQVPSKDLLQRVSRILTRNPKDENMLCAVHAPEVKCISKGKAHKPNEFGVKVSFAATLKDGIVVGDRSTPGKPRNDPTLAANLG